MTNIWTLVLTYNGLDDTRLCLASLAAQAAAGHPILVVDNGSSDGTAAAVGREFPWARVLRIEKNAGPTNGNNVGIEHALAQGAHAVLLLNNDTTVTPNMIDRLSAAAEAHPEYSIIGPVINHMDEPDVVMTDGVTFNPPGRNGLFVPKPVPIARADPPSITPVDVVNAVCMMVRAEVFRAIGLFDVRFFIYHDETDFCLRARRRGFQCGVIGEQHVWHKGGRTVKATGKQFARYYDSRNLVYLLKKHRGAGEHGRGKLETALKCMQYLWHRYCHEREDGHLESADAVIQGFLDGVTGHQGPFPVRRRVLLPPLRGTLELLRHRPTRAAIPFGRGRS
jgi:GT2 family glycosyltransferase